MSEEENDVIKQGTVLEEDEGGAQKKPDLTTAATTKNMKN